MQVLCHRQDFAAPTGGLWWLERNPGPNTKLARHDLSANDWNGFYLGGGEL
jgi:hypothetical protein